MLTVEVLGSLHLREAAYRRVSVDLSVEDGRDDPLNLPKNGKKSR